MYKQEIKLAVSIETAKVIDNDDEKDCDVLYYDRLPTPYNFLNIIVTGDNEDVNEMAVDSWRKNQEDSFESECKISTDQPRVRILLSYLEDEDRNLRILDLGCGCGNVSAKLTNMGFSDVTACDLARIISAYPKTSGVHYIALDLNEEFPDGMYDVMYAGEVIEHLYNDFRFLVNCYNHLNKGGILIVTSPQDPPAKRWYEGGKHIRCYPDRTLEGLVACAGFTIDKFRVQVNKTKTGARTVAIVIAKKGRSVNYES